MNTAATQPTLRQRVEAALLLHPGRDVTLIRLYQLLPDVTNAQVRSALKGLTKIGTAVRHGTIRNPAYQLVRAGSLRNRSAATDRAGAVPAPNGQLDAQAGAQPASVTWPASVKVQRAPASHRGTPFSGLDWSGSMLRPGCQDHQLVPSRRGDVRVPHRGPMGICGARKRREQA